MRTWHKNIAVLVPGSRLQIYVHIRIYIFMHTETFFFF